MNIVISSGKLQVYGEDVKTYKQIPIGCYNVNFSKMTGFFMTIRPNIEVRENKIYGDSEEKIDKILRAYKIMDRNLGVILSGQKGVGKSLFARRVAERANENGMPVIVVNSYIPGIADFLASIEQEVVVIFDEFEKTFCFNKDFDPQEELLTLFDGMEGGKKIFIITCNEVIKLNSYLLNRPGRFHYHFEIGSPTAKEIREYMEDKLLPENYMYIDNVVEFALTVDVTYDYLRAIAFELNMGSTFKEALTDLNITREKDTTYSIIAKFSNGDVYTEFGFRIDLFSERKCTLGFGGINKGVPYTHFSFVPKDKIVNGTKIIVPENKVTFYCDPDDLWDFSNNEEELKRLAEFNNNRKLVSFEIVKEDHCDVKRYAL